MADGENLHPSCQEFHAKVVQSFRDLLDQNGFQVIHQESTSLGARCLLVFASESCRLRFIHDRGGIEVHVGGLEARPTWSDGEQDRRHWYSLRRAVDFVEGRRERTLEEAKEISKAAWEMSTEQYLDDQAAMLRPVARDVCRLFAKDAPPERREAFELYVIG